MSRFVDYLSEEELRRVIANEQARVRSVVDKFLASRTPLEYRAKSAAIVFFHDAIHADPYGDDAKKTKVGRYILDGSEVSRRSVLLASLEALSRSPWESPIWQFNVRSDVRFVHDYHWGALIKALLRTRFNADIALIAAIIQRMSELADRFDSNFPMNAYPYPFAAIVRFVDKHMESCSHDVLTPAITKLFDSIKAGISRDLVTLKGYRKTEAQALANEPERWFVKADRAAIEKIRGWLANH
jgi:hypothetical protein